MNICDKKFSYARQSSAKVCQAESIMPLDNRTLIQMTGNTSLNPGHVLLPGSTSTTEFHAAMGDLSVRLDPENNLIVPVVHRRLPVYGTSPKFKIWPQSSRLIGDLCARVIVTGGKQAQRLPKIRAKARPTIIERVDSRPYMVLSYGPIRSIIFTPDPQRQSWDLGPLTFAA